MAKKNTKKNVEVENATISTITTNASEVGANYVRVEPIDAVVSVMGDRDSKSLYPNPA